VRYHDRNNKGETEERRRPELRVGRGVIEDGLVQHATSSTQMISLHISIFLLWAETYYRRMAARSQGQQPGMATLRPSVDVKDLMTELTKISPKRSESRSQVKLPITDANTEMRVSHKIKLRKSLLSSRRKLCDPVKFRASGHRIHG